MFASPEAIRRAFIQTGLIMAIDPQTVPIHKIIHIRSKTVYKYRRNKLKVRLTALIILLSLFCVNLPLSSHASFVQASEAVSVLSRLGMIKGDGSGYQLDRAITKQESLVMLVRLAGLEAAAQSDNGEGCPFSDVADWAMGYASQAYQNGLVFGEGDNVLGANSQTNARAFLTFTLRMLGYSDSLGDFTYHDAVAFAEEIGLIGAEYSDPTYIFLREDAFLICYTALITPRTGTSEKQIEYLIRTGAIRRDDLLNTGLSGYANYGKRVYSATEIYERTSSAAFLMETFDEEQWQEGIPGGSASGFFISPDGLAVTCYHAIELKPYAKITTKDGRVYLDIEVLYYDGYRDIAILRVGKTSVDEQTVRAFPYIALGDSNAIATGNTVYTLSSPAGFQDCLSEGKISSKIRKVDDPGYPMIQFTAPISPGSSGGVLLNEYCEAIGVLMGAFTAGNDLNLAIPINSIKGVEYASPGKTLKEVCEYDSEQNLKATLTVSESDITLSVGKKATVFVTRDSPGSVGLIYEIENTKIAGCAWGSFITKQTIPIYITGLEKGKTVVTISYYNGTGNPDAKAYINITVI